MMKGSHIMHPYNSYYCVALIIIIIMAGADVGNGCE